MRELQEERQRLGDEEPGVELRAKFSAKLVQPVGVADDDGYLSLVDRKKDLVIVSGFNVYPAEVEDVLLAHPDIARQLGRQGLDYVNREYRWPHVVAQIEDLLGRISQHRAAV